MLDSVGRRGLMARMIKNLGIKDDPMAATWVYPIATACYPSAIKSGEDGILPPKISVNLIRFKTEAFVDRGIGTLGGLYREIWGVDGFQGYWEAFVGASMDEKGDPEPPVERFLKNGGNSEFVEDGSAIERSAVWRLEDDPVVAALEEELAGKTEAFEREERLREQTRQHFRELAQREVEVRERVEELRTQISEVDSKLEGVGKAPLMNAGESTTKQERYICPECNADVLLPGTKCSQCDFLLLDSVGKVSVYLCGLCNMKIAAAAKKCKYCGALFSGRHGGRI